MGLFTHKFRPLDGVLTAMAWLEKGCLEKRLQELADRIDAGEKIGTVSHLVYKDEDDYTGEFNLKQVYDEIESNDYMAKETLKKKAEFEKEWKANFVANATEIGLDLDEFARDDNGDFDIDKELEKIKRVFEKGLIDESD